LLQPAGRAAEMEKEKAHHHVHDVMMCIHIMLFFFHFSLLVQQVAAK